jgi:hypothetical protein
MNKALKVSMIVYGAVGALFGLVYILVPRQAIELQSAEVQASQYLVATKMALGAGILPTAIFGLIAARDPIKNIRWVNFILVFALLFLAVALYCGFVLYADVGQAMVGIVIHGLAVLALIGFYPRGAARYGKV